MSRSEFKKYYQFYLKLHRNRINRRLHIFGQLATLGTLGYALATQTWLLLLAVPFVVYPFAWTGHWFFEKNTPAAWSHPLYAKAADWVMLRDVLQGKIEW